MSSDLYIINVYNYLFLLHNATKNAKTRRCRHLRRHFTGQIAPQAHLFSSIFSLRSSLREAVFSAALPHLFSSIFSLIFYLKKIPAGAGIFIAFILPNKRQIRRQSERQRRLQSPMRRYRRARGECLSGRRPRRTCPWAYVREFSRFSESASRRRS